ncbi:hypothetical protein J2S43_007025 [Catenuloplanes nepalensis]|uniref:Uncharacterized protein n=1 Tax=Catenuloplanes nepalensis TaxID=587533 RepID=A0ABT9N4T1_9ACTN|nr:hypothetical protein [Catenuloplanes nepalensis]MDP9798513.1 hypothetical protein [Catenuloplanes nepalensis]
MPVPDALRALAGRSSFWAEWFFDSESEEGGSERPGLLVTLPVANGYRLHLDLDFARPHHLLELAAPGFGVQEGVMLGWDAPDDGHPHVLRWPELDLIGRVIAMDDPSLTHPGLVVALLSRFTPVTLADDVPVARALFTAAFRALRPSPVEAGPEQEPIPFFAESRWWPAPVDPEALTDTEIDRLLTGHDGRRAGLDWDHHEALGWLATQRAERNELGFPIKSLRTGTEHTFPFSGLAGLLTSARTRLTSEVYGAPWCTTAAVVPLARRMVHAGDLSSVPALVEALEAAGCDHPAVLDALTEPLVPAEAAWVIEEMAGAAPGTLLREVCAGTPADVGRARVD